MTTRPGEHPTPDELDAILDGGGESGLRRHLEGCPDCQGALDRQREIRELLASHATRPAVPPHIADRWLSALAAQPPFGEASPAGALDDGAPDFTAWPGQVEALDAQRRQAAAAASAGTDTATATANAGTAHTDTAHGSPTDSDTAHASPTDARTAHAGPTDGDTGTDPTGPGTTGTGTAHAGPTDGDTAHASPTDARTAHAGPTDGDTGTDPTGQGTTGTGTAHAGPTGAGTTSTSTRGTSTRGTSTTGTGLGDAEAGHAGPSPADRSDPATGQAHPGGTDATDAAPGRAAAPPPGSQAAGRSGPADWAGRGDAGGTGAVPDHAAAGHRSGARLEPGRLRRLRMAVALAAGLTVLVGAGTASWVVLTRQAPTSSAAEAASSGSSSSQAFTGDPQARSAQDTEAADAAAEAPGAAAGAPTAAATGTGADAAAAATPGPLMPAATGPQGAVSQEQVRAAVAAGELRWAGTASTAEARQRAEACLEGLGVDQPVLAAQPATRDGDEVQVIVSEEEGGRWRVTEVTPDCPPEAPPVETSIVSP